MTFVTNPIIRAKDEAVRRKKENALKKMLYLTPEHVFSYQGINNFVYTAIRGVGKSVISVETAIILKRKYGYKNVKCFYFRLTDLSIKAMMKNKAAKAVDPYLIDKYKLEITCKNNIVYDHNEPLIEFYPLVSAGSQGKGVNLYDCNFFPKSPKDPKRFIVTIWDEFLMAEGIEKKSIGDPVAQYKIYREAILRDAERLPYNAVYNFFLANSVSECASVTGALFNYIPKPNNYNRVKLTRKHALFWNVPVTEAYKEKRKKSYNADIMDFDNDPNYTNIVLRDLELIKKKSTRIRKVTNIIQFTKEKTNWFCLYDGKYIRRYRGETFKRDKVISMRRYLDELFNPEAVKKVIERFDARDFKYCDIMSQALFQAQLKLIKQK